MRTIFSKESDKLTKQMKNYLFPIFLFISISGFGQPVFQKHYKNSDYQYSQGNSVAYKVNSLFLLSTEFQGQFDYNIMVTEIDSIGGNVKSTTYSSDSGSTMYGYELIVVNDSCLLIAAILTKDIGMTYHYSASVLIMICNDSILWSKKLHDTTYVNEYIISSVTINGNDIMCGGYSKTNANIIPSSDTTRRGMLIKFDLSGSIVWSNSYGSNKNEITDIANYTDKGVIVCGYDAISIPTGSDIKLMYFAVDSLGFPIWKKQIDVNSGTFNAISKSGNDYLVGGNIRINTDKDGLLLKIDSMGNPIWIRRFGGISTGDDDITKLANNNNNILFTRGSHNFIWYNESTNNATIYAFSNFSTGRLLDMKLIGSNEIIGIGYTQGFGVTNFIKTDTTFFSCIQYVLNYFNYNLPLLVGTDSSFHSSILIDNSNISLIASNSTQEDSVFCSSTTNINEINNNYNTIVIYPNPVTSTFKIKAPTENYPVTYSIFDLTGRIIINTQSTINNEESIDLSELPNGIYLLNLNSNESSKCLKLLKQ